MESGAHADERKQKTPKVVKEAVRRKIEKKKKIEK